MEVDISLEVSMTLMEREFEEDTPSNRLSFMYYWWKYLKRVGCMSVYQRIHFHWCAFYVEDAIQNFILRTHPNTHRRRNLALETPHSIARISWARTTYVPSRALFAGTSSEDSAGECRRDSSRGVLSPLGGAIESSGCI